jgi:hypothetical protein
MQVSIGESIDPAVKKQLMNMMVKKALDLFTEAVQQFVKTVVKAVLPAVWAVVRFIETANDILRGDRRMIAAWENEGGAVVDVR